MVLATRPSKPKEKTWPLLRVMPSWRKEIVVPSTTATPEVLGGTVAVTVVPERERTAMV